MLAIFLVAPTIAPGLSLYWSNRSRSNFSADSCNRKLGINTVYVELIQQPYFKFDDVFFKLIRGFDVDDCVWVCECVCMCTCVCMHTSVHCPACCVSLYIPVCTTYSLHRSLYFHLWNSCFSEVAVEIRLANQTQVCVSLFPNHSTSVKEVITTVHAYLAPTRHLLFTFWCP